MNTTKMVLKLVHISSPNMFWTQYSSEVDKKEDRLQQIIAITWTGARGLKDKIEVRCGNVYLAQYKDNADDYHFYYMARVNTITIAGTVNVFFIDYGNVVSASIASLCVISVSTIRKLPEMPELDLECSLAII